MRRSTARRDLLAVLRARPMLNRWAYINGVNMCLLYLAGFLIYVMSAITLCLEGVPIKFWHDLYRYWPQLLLLLVGQQPDASHRQGINFILLCLLFLGITTYLYFRLQKAFKELRGLWAFSHTPASQSPPFSIAEYLHISLPLWLSPSVLPDPSPSAVLDQVQGTQAEHWAHETAATSEEPAPPVSILISLSDQVTIVLVGYDGKQQSIPIKNNHRAAIIALLAMRGKGVWVSRDEILMLVYGAKGQLEKHLFAVDLSRIKEQIKEGAGEAGLLNGATADAASPLEEVNLFERTALDTNPQWRLSPLCEVEVFGGLDNWHQRVLFAREEDGDSTIGLEELRGGCLQVRQIYGGGLLARYQDTLAIWQWAGEASIMYRNRCRDVLQYAAEREWACARDQQQPVRERREAGRRSAQLHGWIALVMGGLLPDVEESRQALILCLKRYNLLRDLVAARSVFQQYALQMREKDAEWEPGTEITQVWPEATQLRFRRTRKNSQQEE